MKGMTPTRNLTLSIVETVADAVAEPLLVLDSTMRIRTANQAFYQVFRVAEDELIGQMSIVRRLFGLAS